jgi:hypothetical protein
MIIFSTAYLPPVEYFARVINENKIFIEVFETYPKQTYRNRCKILQANGLLTLSIPVNKPFGNKTQTKDIKISYDEEWQIKHWRAIESAYNKSPFFLYYRDEFYFFYKTKIESLTDWNYSLFEFILKKIGVNELEIMFTDSYFRSDNYKYDYRESIHPKKPINTILFPRYYQVFEDKYGFMPNLSIIDLLFNLGPQSKDYLIGVKKNLRIL